MWFGVVFAQPTERKKWLFLAGGDGPVASTTGSVQWPQGLRHIKISAELCHSILARKLWINSTLSFSRWGVETQRAKAVCPSHPVTYNVNSSKLESRLTCLLHMMPHYGLLILLWSSRILRVTKPLYKSCFPWWFISLPYFIWNSTWLKALNYRYLSFGQLKGQRAFVI